MPPLLLTQCSLVVLYAQGYYHYQSGVELVSATTNNTVTTTMTTTTTATTSATTTKQFEQFYATFVCIYRELFRRQFGNYFPNSYFHSETKLYMAQLCLWSAGFTRGLAGRVKELRMEGLFCWQTTAICYFLQYY